MTTTKSAVSAIVRRIGLPARRVRAVAAYLTAASALPAGAPGKSPKLSPEDVVTLVVASVLDKPLRSVAESTDEYRGLVAAGHCAAEIPPSIAARFCTAGDKLDAAAHVALHAGAADIARLQIEVVTSWAEIAVRYPDGSVERFLPAGALSGHWQATGHRTATTINGAAFVDVFHDLFREENK